MFGGPFFRNGRSSAEPGQLGRRFGSNFDHVQIGGTSRRTVRTVLAREVAEDCLDAAFSLPDLPDQTIDARGASREVMAVMKVMVVAQAD